MADEKSNAKAERDAEMQRMKDPTYDPTDNCAPYGTQTYVRKEFRPLRDTKNSTIAGGYAAGKASQVIYDAKISSEGLKCFHLCATIANPISCALCNSDALAKCTFHRIYDDHVETNLPGSCLCWIVDNTRVFYLDRDWAENFEVGGICSPLFTHCMLTPDCFGKFGATVVGSGATNGVCCAGGRRIPTPLPNECFFGGPFFCGFCPIGNAQWVCFPFIDDADKDTFVNKLAAQRSAIKAQHNVIPGKAGLAADKPADGEQQR